MIRSNECYGADEHTAYAAQTNVMRFGRGGFDVTSVARIFGETEGK